MTKYMILSVTHQNNIIIHAKLPKKKPLEAVYSYFSRSVVRQVRLLRDHVQGVRRVGTGAPKIALDHGLKIGEDGVVDGELPFKVRTHLLFHL